MKKILAVLFSLIIFASLASPVFAQAENRLRRNPGDCLYNSPKTTVNDQIVTLDCIPYVFANLIYWLLILSGTVAVFFVIFGGIKYLTSGGDPKKVDSGRKTITWALIGLVVVLLSFAIVRIVAQLTGVDTTCLTQFGFGTNVCL